MDISFRIEDGLVRIVQAGEFEVAAYIATLAAIAAHPDYRPGMRVVSDVSRVTRHAAMADLDKIREALLSGPLQSFRPPRYALVSTSQIFDVMAKLYREVVVEAASELAGGIKIKRFASFEAAEAWARADD